MYTEEGVTGTEESTNPISGREAIKALRAAVRRNAWDKVKSLLNPRK